MKFKIFRPQPKRSEPAEDERHASRQLRRRHRATQVPWCRRREILAAAFAVARGELQHASMNVEQKIGRGAGCVLQVQSWANTGLKREPRRF